MNSEVPLNHHPKTRFSKLGARKSKEVINIKVRGVIIPWQSRVGGCGGKGGGEGSG